MDTVTVPTVQMDTDQDLAVYQLLPVIHRIRDDEQGFPLRALLEIVESELARLRSDVDQLYADWFVETCSEWVLPYLGDLLGVRGLRPVPGVAGLRALVANTIRYRRRKGTLGVLEQVARDVTGWPARVVEYYQQLSATQHLDHVRPGRAGTADLRNAQGLTRVGTPFDTTAHSGDVRHIDDGRGLYNLPNIGLHLWRLSAYPVSRSDARRVGPGWTFDPAGRDVHLFHQGRTEPDDVVHLATEFDVPEPLRRRALVQELSAPQRLELLAEPHPALRIRLDGVPVPPSRMVCRELSNWDPPDDAGQVAPWVAVDPVLGRIMPAPRPAPDRVQVDYAYGYPGDIGAGPHDRRATLMAALGAAEGSTTVDWLVRVARNEPPVPGRSVPTINDALRLWETRTDLTPGQIGVIAVTDSATYLGDLEVSVPAGDRLVLVAASWPLVDPAVAAPPLELVAQSARGPRPHLVGSIAVSGEDARSSFVVDGMSIEGNVTVVPGDLGAIVLADCTLTSGRLEVADNAHLNVDLRRSIFGSLNLPGVPTVALTDCVLFDGHSSLEAADARVTIEGCTLLGPSTARVLTASNTLFCAPVTARNVQSGCVRFSYLAPDSRSPRRYRCQPTTTAAAAAMSPRFTSLRPEDPGFAQLARDCPVEITRGADDEDEMGVYHFLQQSVRLSNLTSQLDAYLRFGLEVGVLFAT